MARLNLRLLGDFEARLGSGPPLRLRARKTQALLAYLASSPGQTYSRDKLASLLWGDSSQSQARSRLRGSLFVLRRTLASANPPCLVLDSDAVALDVDAVDVDVVDFGRLVRARDPEALAKAVELYCGDLLEGFAFRGALFEEWLIAERERLREMAIDGLAKLLVHQRSTGVFEAAVQTGLRLVALDPLQESVHRTLMRLYAELGRRAAALRQYQMCVRVLQRELGVEPEAETKRLYQQLVRRQPHSSEKAPDRRRLHNRHDAKQLPDLLRKDTPVFGREAERAHLRQVLAEAAKGHGSVVTVVGEAGIGKTSVVGALAADAIALGARVMLGRCYESASILPFGPWVDAFRSGQTLEDEGVFDGLRPVWRSEVARLLPEADTEGLPAPSDNQLRLFEGVGHFVDSLAARRVLVLVLEDIHWADEMSLRLLAFISRRTASWRVFVLTTAREQELADTSVARRTLEELGRELHATSLKLAPLSRPDTALLVRSLSRVGSDAAALTRLEEQVWVVSEGNPFVVVEMMRALDEGSIVKGSATLPLPKRVREVIADRLSRLSDRGRQFAAVAAVIGREFDFALLQRASGCDEATAAEGVEELVRRGVLQGTDDRFDFTHDRIRAVINAELLLPHRKLIHRQVGAALEALRADDLGTQSAALGSHYRAGEVWDKAVRYLWRAGTKAMERSALRDAITRFEDALSALSHLPESRVTLENAFDIRLDLRLTLNQLGELPRVLTVLRDAEPIADKLDDDRRRGRVHWAMVNTHNLRNELDAALTAGARARQVADALGEVGLRVATATALEQTHFYRGEYAQVVALARANLDLAERLPVDQSVRTSAPAAIFDRHWLLRALTQLGRFTETTEVADTLILFAGRTQVPIAQGLAHFAVGTVHMWKGDWSRARAFHERAVRILEDGEQVLQLSYVIGPLAWALAGQGETEEAASRASDAEQRLDQIRLLGRKGGGAETCICLCHCYLILQRLEDADRMVARTLEDGTAASEAQALRLQAEITMHPRRRQPKTAEDSYQRALALAEPRGMRPLVAHCHLGLGKLYRRTGKREQACEHFSTATSMYRDMGMTYWLEQAEAEKA